VRTGDELTPIDTDSLTARHERKWDSTLGPGQLTYICGPMFIRHSLFISSNKIDVTVFVHAHNVRKNMDNQT